MIRNFVFLLTIALIPTLTSCTFYHVNAEEIVFRAHYPQEDLRKIQYLETVNVPYDVLGTVVVRTERRNNMEEVVEKMKQQIAVLGGDAVTNIIQVDHPSSFTNIRTTYKGTVIAFKKDDSAPVTSAPATGTQPIPEFEGENFK